MNKPPYTQYVPRAQPQYIETIRAFKGIDQHDNQFITDNTSAEDMLNMYIDENKLLSCRPKLSLYKKLDSKIKDAFRLKDRTLVLLENTKLYFIYKDYIEEIINSTDTLVDNLNNCFEYKTKVWIVPDFVIENNVLSIFSPYIPIVEVAGGETTLAYESLNILTDKYNVTSQISQNDSFNFPTISEDFSNETYSSNNIIYTNSDDTSKSFFTPDGAYYFKVDGTIMTTYRYDYEQSSVPKLLHVIDTGNINNIPVSIKYKNDFTIAVMMCTGSQVRIFRNNTWYVINLTGYKFKKWEDVERYYTTINEIDTPYGKLVFDNTIIDIPKIDESAEFDISDDGITLICNVSYIKDEEKQYQILVAVYNLEKNIYELKLGLTHYSDYSVFFNNAGFDILKKTYRIQYTKFNNSNDLFLGTTLYDASTGINVEDKEYLGLRRIYPKDLQAVRLQVQLNQSGTTAATDLAYAYIKEDGTFVSRTRTGTTNTIATVSKGTYIVSDRIQGSTELRNWYITLSNGTEYNLGQNYRYRTTAGSEAGLYRYWSYYFTNISDIDLPGKTKIGDFVISNNLEYALTKTIDDLYYIWNEFKTNLTNIVLILPNISFADIVGLNVGDNGDLFIFSSPTSIYSGDMLYCNRQEVNKYIISRFKLENKISSNISFYDISYISIRNIIYRIAQYVIQFKINYDDPLARVMYSKVSITDTEKRQLLRNKLLSSTVSILYNNSYWLGGDSYTFYSEPFDFTYFPISNYNEYENKTITGFNAIGDNALAILHTTGYYLASQTSYGEQGETTIQYNEAKSKLGNIAVNGVITSRINEIPLHVYNDGIYALTLIENVQSTERNVINISTNITQKLLQEKLSEVFTFNSYIWTFFCFPNGHMYIWDNENWFYWELNVPIIYAHSDVENNIYVYSEDTVLILDQNDDNYIDYNDKRIDWFWRSTRFNLKGEHKQLEYIRFLVNNKNNNNYDFLYDIKTWPIDMGQTKAQLGGSVDVFGIQKIRTFVQNFEYLQLTINNNPKNASKVQLNEINLYYKVRRL